MDLKKAAGRTVWLIRHAESEANSGLPTHDPGTINITEQGIAQAKAVAAYFTEPPSLIVTSPFVRTQQTAQFTINRFTGSRCEQWPIQEFTYLDASRCIGTTALQRRPMVDEYWERSDPNYCDGPDAESFANLIKRIAWFKAHLSSQNESFIAIITHGLFIRMVLWTMLTAHLPLDAHYMKQAHIFCNSFAYPNGGILKMQISNALYVGPLITSHLNET